MRYNDSFKASIVEKLTAPGGPSATQLAQQIGIGQPTLSRWVRRASMVGGMKHQQSHGSARRPQEWSAEEKLAVVTAAAGLEGEALGALLRQRGVHQAQLESWRQQMLSGLSTATHQGSQRSAPARRLRELERELRRKDKALAEAAALLVLQKNDPRQERPTCGLETWGEVASPSCERRGRQLFGVLNPQKNLAQGQLRTCQW